MAKQKYISATDLYKIQLIQGCEISPNGLYILYGLSGIDKKTEEKHLNLWVVNTQSLVSKQLTYGKHHNGQAKWSPDGSKIAFISNRADKKQSQIYILPFKEGGEAQQLTQLQGAITNLQWNPDGKSILFGFKAKSNEAIARDKDPKKQKLGIVAYHYTEVFYKFDGLGYLSTKKWGISLVKVKSTKVQHLIKSDTHDNLSANWNKQGDTIVFTSNRNDKPNFNIEDVQVYTFNLKTKAEQQITRNDGTKMLPAFSGDGQYIAYYGKEGKGNWWRNQNLFLVKTDGSQANAPTNLTAAFDMHVDGGTLNDMNGTPELSRPTFSIDNQSLYFQVAKHGSNTIYCLQISDKSISPVFAYKGTASAFTLDKTQTQLATIYATMNDMGQIALHQLHPSDTPTSPIVCTNVNQKWLQKRQLSAVEEVWFKGSNDNDVQGWIMYPPNFDPNHQYPSILEIHGGPLLQYGESFMYEFYFLAAQGYVVYFCNPRGGQGYGEAHSKSIHNNWGTVDYDDLMVFADLMQEKPYIDAKNMGITGGSYGGYMTCWAIGHTQRFKAAVTQRCVSNLISMWGSSDFNWAFQLTFGEKPPFENLDNYWRMSPMKHIGNATTPTLVIHSEKDFRCNLEQSEQVYVALKYLGVDTELVIFPGEPHGLSRNGRTDKRIVRLQHILRWFDKYLKKTIVA